MKITGFNPMILTKAEDAEAVIKTFEALGFERRHNKVNEMDMAFNEVRMKDENGFYVDVVSGKLGLLERDLNVTRINVDDFDEAAEMLKSKGFRESKIISEFRTETSKYAFYVAPSGLIINLVQHIK